MPYIGRDLNRGNYLKLDDISSSFDGSTKTFNLTSGGTAFTPGSAFSILVSVDNVILEPETAYQVDNTEITFTTAPSGSDSFFCIVLGIPLGIGVPGSSTVNGIHLAKPLNYDNYFYLDSVNNRVGIGSLTPSETLDIIGNAKISGIVTATSFSGPLVGNTNNTSGLSTFYDLRVTNNLTVEGTTTTLDTDLTAVDRVEVDANSNSIVGVAITQSGTADIINLFDGTSQVVTVDDEGKIGLGTDAPSQKLHIEHDSFHQILLKRVGAGPSEAIFANAGNYTDIKNNASGVKFSVGSTPESKMVVRPVGVGIGTLLPRGDFHINDNNPALVFSENDAAADNKYWRTHINGQTWTWDGLNDSLTSGDNNFRMTRSGNQITAFQGRVSGSTWFNVSNSTQKVGIGTDNPSDLLDVHKNSSTAYDATDDDAQRNDSASITIRNDNGTTNSFSQLVFDTAGSNQSIARIVAIRTGSATNDLAFVTEHSNTKAERLRIKSGGQTLFTGVSGTTPIDIKTSNNTNNSTQPIIEAYTDNSSRKAQIALARESVSKENGWVFLTSTDADSTSQERLRITSDGQIKIPDGGKLGVNGVAPQTPIDVIANSSGYAINVRGRSSDNIGEIRFTSNNYASLYSAIQTGATYLNIQVGSTTNALRIDSSGRLLVGKTSSTLNPRAQIGGRYVDASGATLDLNTTGSAGPSLELFETGNTANNIALMVFNHGSLKSAIGGGRKNTNNWGTDLRFYTHKDNTTDQHETYERMRITSGGNVGIGSLVPTAKLEIFKSGTTGYLFRSMAGLTVGNRSYDLKPPSSNSIDEPFSWSTGNAHAFQVDGVERLRVHSNGNVGVNTTGPSQQFTSFASSGYPILANGLSNGIGLGSNGVIVFGTRDVASYAKGILDATDFEFKISGSPKVTIASTGYVGINESSPSSQLHVKINGLSDNAYNFRTTYKSGNNASGYTASGITLTGTANNSSGDKHTTFINFNSRDPSLNGSHGAGAYIAMSNPDSQGSYGTGQLDFYIRNSAAYTFPNDPQAASNYWMDPLFTIKSSGNIGVAGVTGTDFSLLDGMVINTGNGKAGLIINSSSSSHNAYLSFGYGSGSGTSHDDQYSAYIGRVGDDTLILGAGNQLKVTIGTDGEVKCIGADDNKGFAVYTSATKKVAELIEHAADGELRLYTGEATPTLRSVFTSYGNSYINSGGTNNFGVGTDSPEGKIHIVSDADPALRIEAKPVTADTGAKSKIHFHITQSNGQYARLAEIHSLAESGWGGGMAFNYKPRNGVANNTTEEVFRFNHSANAATNARIIFDAYLQMGGYNNTNESFANLAVLFSARDMAGSTLVDGQSDTISGYARKRTTSDSSGTFFFGPYGAFPCGDYTALFRLKVSDNSSTSDIGYIDVIGSGISAEGRNKSPHTSTARSDLTPSDWTSSDKYQYFAIDFSKSNNSANIETRFLSYNNTRGADVYFDHVLILPRLSHGVEGVSGMHDF